MPALGSDRWSVFRAELHKISTTCDALLLQEEEFGFLLLRKLY
jgi:hypothetical protein